MDISRYLVEAVCEINIAFSPDDVPDDQPLIKTGILDSFGFVQLIVRIENDFKLDVADDEMVEDNFGTLQKIAAFIVRRTRRG